MTLSVIKLIAASCILFLALIAGFLPIRWRQQEGALPLLEYGEFFAKGVFLGAGLIHLLPDAVRLFKTIYPSSYPLAELIVVLVVWLLFTLEQGFGFYFRHYTQHFLPLLLVAVLSFHAIIEGLVLGVDITLASFIIIFIAIIAHKGAEAFALGISISRFNITKRMMFLCVSLFALMTPMGILGGGLVIRFMQANPEHWLQAIFNAVAAGTFIYLATMEHHHDCAHSEENVLLQSAMYGFGVLIMALAARWT